MPSKGPFAQIRAPFMLSQHLLQGVVEHAERPGASSVTDDTAAVLVSDACKTVKGLVEHRKSQLLVPGSKGREKDRDVAHLSSTAGDVDKLLAAEVIVYYLSMVVVGTLTFVQLNRLLECVLAQQAVDGCLTVF